MYLRKPPYLYRKLLSNAVFTAPSEKVFLTFDDGPTPSVTPQVLDILSEKSVSATFFLLGKNAKGQPELVTRLRNEGHTVANHGYEHLDGWKVDEEAFLQNVNRGAEIVDSKLFRPPYGRLWPGLMRLLNDHKVIMWDLLSGDFDQSQTATDTVQAVLSNVKSGSIIVMHDSETAKANVLGSLARIIDGVRLKGLEFGNIQDV